MVFKFFFAIVPWNALFVKRHCRENMLATKETSRLKRFTMKQNIQMRTNYIFYSMRKSLTVSNKRGNEENVRVPSESTNHDPDQWNVITQQIASGPFSRANEEELIRVLLVRQCNVLVLNNYSYDERIKFSLHKYISGF